MILTLPFSFRSVSRVTRVWSLASRLLRSISVPWIFSLLSFLFNLHPASPCWVLCICKRASWRWIHHQVGDYYFTFVSVYLCAYRKLSARFTRNNRKNNDMLKSMQLDIIQAFTALRKINLSKWWWFWIFVKKWRELILFVMFASNPSLNHDKQMINAFMKN